MRNIYLLLFFSLFLFSTCKDKGKKNNDDIPTKCNGFIPLPLGLKEYFAYKDSSYWIYKDSISGVIDSFWVEGYKRIENSWPYQYTQTYETPCYEIILYNVYRKLYNYSEKIQIGSYFNNKGFENERFNITFILEKNNFRRPEERFATHLGSDSLLSETPIKGGFIYYLNELEINSKTYQKIIFLNYPIRNPYDWVRRIYYAKNVGVIKFEDEEGRIWELIRHNVKQ